MYGLIGLTEPLEDKGEIFNKFQLGYFDDTGELQLLLNKGYCRHYRIFICRIFIFFLTII
jgi:hypothetical protein